MRVLLHAVCCTVMLFLFSCSKDKGAGPAEEQTEYKAAYAANVFSVSKGVTFTSAALQHNFPAGVNDEQYPWKVKFQNTQPKN